MNIIMEAFFLSHILWDLSVYLCVCFCLSVCLSVRLCVCACAYVTIASRNC